MSHCPWPSPSGRLLGHRLALSVRALHPSSARPPSQPSRRAPLAQDQRRRRRCREPPFRPRPRPPSSSSAPLPCTLRRATDLRSGRADPRSRCRVPRSPSPRRACTWPSSACPPGPAAQARAWRPGSLFARLATPQERSCRGWAARTRSAGARAPGPVVARAPPPDQSAAVSQRRRRICVPAPVGQQRRHPACTRG